MSEPRRLYTAQPVRAIEPAQSLDIALTLTRQPPAAACTPQLLWVAYCKDSYSTANVTVEETGDTFVSPTPQALRLSVSPY